MKTTISRFMVVAFTVAILVTLYWGTVVKTLETKSIEHQEKLENYQIKEK